MQCKITKTCHAQLWCNDYSYYASKSGYNGSIILYMMLRSKQFSMYAKDEDIFKRYFQNNKFIATNELKWWSI